MTEPHTPSLAETLGTDDPQLQAVMAHQMSQLGQLPVFCLVLYLDPRQKNGFSFQLVGPNAPIGVLREMLRRAQDHLTEQEVEARVQQATQNPPTLEP